MPAPKSDAAADTIPAESNEENHSPELNDGHSDGPIADQSDEQHAAAKDAGINPEEPHLPAPDTTDGNADIKNVSHESSSSSSDDSDDDSNKTDSSSLTTSSSSSTDSDTDADQDTCMVLDPPNQHLNMDDDLMIVDETPSLPTKVRSWLPPSTTLVPPSSRLACSHAATLPTPKLRAESCTWNPSVSHTRSPIKPLLPPKAPCPTCAAIRRVLATSNKRSRDDVQGLDNDGACHG
ncbi:hypothetical protein BCR44DRAFT_341999 [Catenaria anguillulae PL171]|uniref:Uncharacterized protein n=1 Tax=Catenaria anguillulae PL171 TaxID=765915 RepID=A0A1Y2I4C0_9FUNG|nr:hypothetical protein BCR44DRAFT_341999 [Catenaria anguillulae PL171]